MLNTAMHTVSTTLAAAHALFGQKMVKCKPGLPSQRPSVTVKPSWAAELMGRATKCLLLSELLAGQWVGQQAMH